MTHENPVVREYRERNRRPERRHRPCKNECLHLGKHSMVYTEGHLFDRCLECGQVLRDEHWPSASSRGAQGREEVRE